MKNNIMFTLLTLVIICGILTLVGCKSGKLFIFADNKQKLGENINNDNITNLSDDEEVMNEEITSGDESSMLRNDDNIQDYVYNEKGRIIIVMYHKFAQVETSDEWTRSFENFYNDLLYLYEHNYRSVSLNDYLNNSISVPVGCTPIIFTFDDGSKGQFNLIRTENGELIANPDSAVGVMEKFNKEHPDFRLNGTFFINGTGFFGSVGTAEEKLSYLINKGFEIGNHTNTHINFSKATIEEIQTEIGSVNNTVKEVTNGYEVTALALPYGISSRDYKSYIVSGDYQGQKYENKAILLVGSSPVYAPTSKKVNFLSLPRVRARGGEKAVDFDLYYWLDIMEKNPEMKYERIQ